MRWRRLTNFIVCCILSIFYVLVAAVNLLGTLHQQIITIHGPMFHPYLCLTYLICALLITWSIYLYYRNEPGLWSFFLTLIVGMMIIFFGLFLWDFAIEMEDVVRPMPKVAEIQNPILQND